MQLVWLLFAVALASEPDKNGGCYYHCVSQGDISGHYLRDDEERSEIVCSCDHERRIRVKKAKAIRLTPLPGPVPTVDAMDYYTPSPAFPTEDF